MWALIVSFIRFFFVENYTFRTFFFPDTNIPNAL